MSLYTKEELAAARAARKAEREREKELLKGKTKEQQREIKRVLKEQKEEKKVADKVAKLDSDNIEALHGMIMKYAGDAIEKRAQELAQAKADETVAQWEEVKNGKELQDKVCLEFTTPQLIRIFDGWFTLRYLFSIKTGVTDKDGNEIETDFYCCSKDVSLLPESKRPKRNDAIFNAYGVEVYGFAIIAPSTAFM